MQQCRSSWSTTSRMNAMPVGPTGPAVTTAVATCWSETGAARGQRSTLPIPVRRLGALWRRPGLASALAAGSAAVRPEQPGCISGIHQARCRRATRPLVRRPSITVAALRHLRIISSGRSRYEWWVFVSVLSAERSGSYTGVARSPSRRGLRAQPWGSPFSPADQRWPLQHPVPACIVPADPQGSAAPPAV
jgi:hypothetical protein